MFKITMGKGFYMEFANGWGISVQWGPGNYCDNNSIQGFSEEAHIKAGAEGSKNAECAVFGPSGEFCPPEGWGDDVKGYMSPDDVLQLMEWVAEQ